MYLLQRMRLTQGKSFTPQVVGKFATILDPLREDNWGEKETRGVGYAWWGMRERRWRKGNG